MVATVVFPGASVADQLRALKKRDSNGGCRLVVNGFQPVALPCSS
jgi:hypothetical protein